MKTAYQLAMERLSKTAPAVKLNAEQKRRIAELESRCKAKIAERGIAIRDEIAKAAETGDGDKIAELEERLVKERKKLQADLEAKKEQVGNVKG